MLERASLESPIFTVENAATDPRGGGLTRAGLNFYASVALTLAGTERGYLCVFGADARTLSGAEEYVLRTLAAEIQVCFAAAEPAPETLTARLQFFEAVLGNANDSIIITEAEPLDAPDGPRVLYANAAFAKMTGYDVGEVIGKTPRVLQGPDTDPDVRRRIGAALRRWEPIQIELLNYRKDGSTFWVELSISPVADESGYFTHWISVQRDVSERHAAEELAASRANAVQAEFDELARRASQDGLTGLANRGAFNERVAAAIAAARLEPPQRSAVLFLDLDRFKAVNDNLGHRAGDLLLIEIARRLRTCLRPMDELARIGGDEFVALIANVADAESISAIASRIITALAKPIRLSGTTIVTQGSIGVRLINGRCSSPEDALRDADIAMYRAKNSGGARFAIFDERLDARGAAALRAQMDFAGGLARREFVLHYQPIVELATGRVTALEALVRWQHPERGLIYPGDFIEAAEDSGAIVELGAWVLDEACRQMLVWNAMRTPGDALAVSVNVSSRQLDDHGFLTTFREALQRTGIDPRALILEITESAFLEHSESVGALLDSIRATGTRIALDDFGTGYSSLSYLERFPVDTLKIDRSFVERLATSKTTTEIVRLIIGLATALEMTVTAEGIEDASQLAALERCGCSHGQGYFFSRPMPSAGVEAYLAGTRVVAVAAAAAAAGAGAAGL